MFSQEAHDAILAEERAELQQQQIDIDAMQSAAETSAVTEAMGPVGLPVQHGSGARDTGSCSSGVNGPCL